MNLAVPAKLEYFAIFTTSMQITRILLIQTAYIGDVVLATPLIQQLSDRLPEAKIDFLLRKGNENLLENDPKINQVLVWDKKSGKFNELLRLVANVRKNKYDLLINVHRFTSTGLVSAFSGARIKIGFDKNPLSLFYDHKVKHEIGNGLHEVERNLKLLETVIDVSYSRPSLHLLETTRESVKPFKSAPYITLAPTSVWFTKQFPAEKWALFLRETTFKGNIYLLGGPADHAACDQIISLSGRRDVINLCGKLTLTESAALMEDSVMNYVNDSAPMHFSSAVNAPTTALFCSTVPDFGFGPLADDSAVVQTDLDLDCRPCGLHGYSKCPKGHFRCTSTVDVRRLEERLIAR